MAIRPLTRFGTPRLTSASHSVRCELARPRLKTFTLGMSRPMKRRSKRRGMPMVAPNLPVPSAGTTEPSRYGEIFDRGYKHYDGPRLGRRGAFFALIRYSMKRALGIKKSWTAKIIPIFLY